MKKLTTLIALLTSIVFQAAAQTNNVGIGTVTPNASAALEVTSPANDKGLRIPTVALSAAILPSPLAAHVAGMIVYNTVTSGTSIDAVRPGFYYNNGTRWMDADEVLTKQISLVNTTTPAGISTGQIIYNTNALPTVPVGPAYWNATEWRPLAQSASSGGGGGSIIPFSSGTPVAATTIAGGLAGTVSLLGFGNSSSGVSLSGNSIDLTGGGGTALNFAFSAPRSGTMTSISAYFTTTVGLSLTGSNVSVRAQLYRSSGTDNTFTPISGAVVNLAAFTGVVTSGNVRNGTATGLNVPIAAGERYLLVISASATGVSLLNTVTGYASAGINIE